MLRPTELDTGSSSAGKILPMPWRPLKRAIATEEEEQRSDSLQTLMDTSKVSSSMQISIVIPFPEQLLQDMKKHQELLENGLPYSKLPSALKSVKDTQAASSTLNTGNSTDALQAQISSLEGELLRLYEHHNKVKRLHDGMYNTMVDRFMAKRRKKTSDQQ